MVSTSPRANSEDHPECTLSSWNSTAHLLMGALVGEMLERRLGLHLALTVSHFLVLLKVSRQIWCVGKRDTRTDTEGSAAIIKQLGLANTHFPLFQGH